MSVIMIGGRCYDMIDSRLFHTRLSTDNIRESSINYVVKDRVTKCLPFRYFVLSPSDESRMTRIILLNHNNYIFALLLYTSILHRRKDSLSSHVTIFNIQR